MGRRGLFHRAVNRQLMLGSMVALLAGLGIMGAPSAQARSVSLNIAAAQKTVEFGQKARLKIKLSGAWGGKTKDATLKVMEAAFPYSRYSAIQEGSLKGLAFSPTVTPALNSRYRVVVALSDGQTVRSNTQLLYVEPIRTGDKIRITPKVFVYRGGKVTMSSRLLPAWRKLSRSQKSVYLYSRCAHQNFYKRRAAKGTRVKVRGSRMTITWPAFRVKNNVCGRNYSSDQLNGMLRLAGFLANGDDGAGKPRVNGKRYRAAIKLMGKARIPAKTAKRVLGW